MTPIDILIKICDVKFADIGKRSDVVLWTDQDREDLQSWDMNTTKRVLTRMAVTNCPWCIRFEGKCEGCSYGKHHGICRHARSDFRQAETDRKKKHLPYLSEDALIDIGRLLKGYKECP
ncbi:MAG: hypothetical protein KJ737_25990 [Proteobacteria bacterium]|nr:hypothetical protein [Pseudomonadota bacterium]